MMGSGGPVLRWVPHRCACSCRWGVWWVCHLRWHWLGSWLWRRGWSWLGCRSRLGGFGVGHGVVVLGLVMAWRLGVGRGLVVLGLGLAWWRWG